MFFFIERVVLRLHPLCDGPGKILHVDRRGGVFVAAVETSEAPVAIRSKIAHSRAASRKISAALQSQAWEQ
ncbi:hypothetical protein FV217_19790 [Methylobacterium sp. WL9]|nr:hypothetical protein FV217_19790 [Methylobacterium sp. WL9]